MTVPTAPPSGVAAALPGSVRRPAVFLFVESSLRENGGIRVSLEHARRLRSMGASTVVAVLQDVDDGPLAAPDPELPVRMLSRRGARLRHAAPAALVRLVRLARRSDVLIAGSEIGPSVLLGFTAARLARRPFAVLVQASVDNSLRDWVSPRLRPLTRAVLRRVDAGICVTEAVVPSLLETGLPAERVHVVLNGVDVHALRAGAGLPPSPVEAPGAVDRPGPSSGCRPAVVANGRLSEAKGYATLLHAHARVRAAGIDHELVIMGEGPQRGELESLARDLGVTDSVSLPGFVREPHRRMATADLFVLSSITEGLPLTLLEAMSIGVPIVATRCEGGPAFLLEDGRYGDLVPSGSVDALAGAIERHLLDPGPLRDKARTAPLRALEFDSARTAADLLAVLGSVSGTAVAEGRYQSC